MRIGLIFLTAFCLFIAATSADEAKSVSPTEVTLVMKDGSRIEGKLLQYVGGHFLIEIGDEDGEVRKLDVAAKDVEAVLFGNREKRANRAERLSEPDNGEDDRERRGERPEPDDMRLGPQEQSDENNAKKVELADGVAKKAIERLYSSDLQNPLKTIFDVVLYISARKTTKTLPDLMSEHENKLIDLRKNKDAGFPDIFIESIILAAAHIDQKQFEKARKYLKEIQGDRRLTWSMERVVEMFRKHIERAERDDAEGLDQFFGRLKSKRGQKPPRRKGSRFRDERRGPE